MSSPLTVVIVNILLLRFLYTYFLVDKLCMYTLYSNCNNKCTVYRTFYKAVTRFDNSFA